MLKKLWCYGEGESAYDFGPRQVVLRIARENGFWVGRYYPQTYKQWALKTGHTKSAMRRRGNARRKAALKAAQQ